MKQTERNKFEEERKAEKWKRSDYDVFRKKRDEHQSLKFRVEKNMTGIKLGVTATDRMKLGDDETWAGASVKQTYKREWVQARQVLHWSQPPSNVNWNESHRMNQYHWNPIHYVHFPTNSLNEFSKISSYMHNIPVHGWMTRFSFTISPSHALISFSIPPNPVHSLHSTHTNICFVGWFQIVTSTNVNMIKLNLGWLNVRDYRT